MTVHKTFRTAVILLAGLTASPASLARADSPLWVHLPREVTAREDSLTLASVAILRGDDKAAVTNAGMVAMGRAPWPGEKIVIGRRTILARLAATGLDKRHLKITGAEEVVVGRGERVISAEEILSVAEAFLGRNRPGPAGCGWKLVRQPKEILIPDLHDIHLEARFPQEQPTGNFVAVQVAVVGQGKERSVRDTLFRLAYPRREVIVEQAILAGAVISTENTKVKTVLSDSPEPTAWVPPYGMLAIRALAPGAVIRQNMVSPFRGEVKVKRNQAVSMIIDGLGFSLSGLGLALQDGRAGEFIRVRNVDSGRIVTARVAFDGAVHPVFREVGR